MAKPIISLAYLQIISKIEFYFTSIGLTVSKASENPIKFWIIIGFLILQSVFYTYCFLWEPSCLFVKTQHLWGVAILLQVISKAINWKLNFNTIRVLISWFESSHTQNPNCGWTTIYVTHNLRFYREIRQLIR